MPAALRLSAAMCASGRTLADPRLSPDADRVAVLASAAGGTALVVLPAGGGPEVVVAVDPPPSGTHPSGGGVHDWLPDGSGLVHVGAGGGLWVVPAAGGPGASTGVEGDVRAPAVSPDATRVAYVRDERHVEVAGLVPGGPGPLRLTDGGGADFAFDPVWSPDGEWVLWHEWDVPQMPWDASRIVRRRADGTGPVEVVAGGSGDHAVALPSPSPDGRALAFLSDATGWMNVWVSEPDGSGARPLVDERFEHAEPSWGMGMRSLAWSSDGGRIAFRRNEGGFGRLCSVHVGSGELTEVDRGWFAALSWRAGRLVALRSGARTPTQVVVYEDGGRRPLARGPVGGFEEAGLVEPELVSWRAEDGARVPGRLYRPPRPLGDPPPLLLWVHGGPTGQQVVRFDARVAYFVERGWAVLVPDHRGTSGHGRAFAQALRGRWGELDVTDCGSGLVAAAEGGWGDPARMVPIGASAGGFTVLHLLARFPERCAAGIDLFGVTDLADLDERTHRFERHYNQGLVGARPEHEARYLERSPLHLAERIGAPLLVLHGSADPVVPLAQSEALVARLRASGRPVELRVFEGAGHGWSSAAAVADELTAIEAFLGAWVPGGGR